MDLATMLYNMAYDIEADKVVKYMKKDYKNIPTDCFSCHYCSNGTDLCFHPDNKKKTFKEDCNSHMAKGSIIENKVFPNEIMGMLENMNSLYLHLGFYEKTKHYFESNGWDIDKFMYPSICLGKLSCYYTMHHEINNVLDFDIYPTPDFIKDFLMPYVGEWRIVFFYNQNLRQFDIDLYRKAHEGQWEKDSISIKLAITCNNYLADIKLWRRGANVHSLKLDGALDNLDDLQHTYNEFSAVFKKYESVTHCQTCLNWYEKGCAGGAEDIDSCKGGYCWVDWTKYFYDCLDAAV